MTENLIRNDLNQNVGIQRTQMSLESSGFWFSLRKAKISLNPVSLLPSLSIVLSGRANSQVGCPYKETISIFSALPAL